MELVLLFPIFVLGLAIGSFVNVLIYRTLKNESPWEGRSYCDNCRRQLSWYENIPVVSYLVLGGKCRTCKKKISWTYPVVEMVTGLLFVWWGTLGFAFFQLTRSPLLYLQPLFWLFVGLVLVVIFFADFKYGIIPDFAVAALGLSSLLYRGFLVYVGEMQGRDFVLAVVSGLVALAAFFSLLVVTRGRGMGFGDVKFALVMGFLLGYPRVVVGFFLSFLLGGAVAVGLLLAGKKKFGQALAFGPFLIAGLILALLWGGQIWGWYFSLL